MLSPDTKTYLMHTAADFASRTIAVFVGALVAGMLLVPIGYGYISWQMERAQAERMERMRENMAPFFKR